MISFSYFHIIYVQLQFWIVFVSSCSILKPILKPNHFLQVVSKRWILLYINFQHSLYVQIARKIPKSCSQKHPHKCCLIKCFTACWIKAFAWIDQVCILGTYVQNKTSWVKITAKSQLILALVHRRHFQICNGLKNDLNLIFR